MDYTNHVFRMMVQLFSSMKKSELVSVTETLDSLDHNELAEIEEAVRLLIGFFNNL